MMQNKRKLGQQGLFVSPIGLGCMGLTWAYGPTNEAESQNVLQRAYDLGIRFWDTAEVYGPYNNEELIGRVMRSLPREKLIIATKFGFRIDDANQISGVNSDPKHIRHSIEGSLKRLNTDYIDLYYQHRLDPNVPIEDVMFVLASLVQEGKIKYIGLSEVGATTIRRAHAVHPVTALQSEYSLWETGVEEKILPTLKELGIGFVPYSPLGRGFLTGKITSIDNLDDTDWRRASMPRIQGDNLAHNLELVQQLQEVAAKHHVTPAQIALAWILRQDNSFVPIPGTKHVRYLEENVQAINITLPDEDWIQLDKMIRAFKASGDRYLSASMDIIERE